MVEQSEGVQIEQQDRSPHTCHTRGQFFQIQIKGQLSSDWADWLEGMEMISLENGEMVLCGKLLDQSELMGVLAKLHRLNITILSVNGIDRKAIRRKVDPNEADLH